MGSIGDLPLASYRSVDRCELVDLRYEAQLIMQSPPEQSLQVFSLVISLVAVGSVVITINSKLLGGKVYVSSARPDGFELIIQIVLPKSCKPGGPSTPEEQADPIVCARLCSCSYTTRFDNFAPCP
jgi:hypothetical protein